MKLVSAIMPTKGRREWAHQALQCFLDQTYPNKQLVIFDDVDEPSFPEFRDGDIGSLVIRRVSSRFNIPAKRNFACVASKGEILMHFDSDDWSAPERMADQVQRLEESGLPVTGYKSMFFYQVETGRAFKYVGAFRDYAIGTSLAFSRPWWEKHPFPESFSIGEDNEIVNEARKQKQITCVDAACLMVARIHSQNTCAKNLNGDSYQPIDVVQLPKGFAKGEVNACAPEGWTKS